MDFKKYGIVYLLIFLVVVLGISYVIVRPGERADSLPVTPVPESLSATPASVLAGVSVGIDYGDKRSDYTGIEADTAYAALVEVLKQEDIPYSFKQYSFGILVDRIGDKSNTTDRAWIYFINGNSGDVSAEQKKLQNGDKVEWRYIQPN